MNAGPATLAHRRWGDGDTAIVLLHGVGGSRDAWADNGPALEAAGFAAIAVDLPGYGESPSIEPYDMAGLARSVQVFVESLGAQRTVLVGHSLGGMVAQEAVALAPACVHGLVIAGASPAFGKAGGTWQEQFLRERFAPLDAGVGMAGLAPQLVTGMVAPRARPDAVRAAAKLMAAVPETTYRQALLAVVAFDRRANLARINVPTLCITGAHDRNAPPAMVQQMALRIRGAEYICLDGAGHLANIEVPTAFNRALVSFLTRHFGGA